MSVKLNKSELAALEKSALYDHADGGSVWGERTHGQGSHGGWYSHGSRATKAVRTLHEKGLCEEPRVHQSRSYSGNGYSYSNWSLDAKLTEAGLALRKELFGK